MARSPEDERAIERLLRLLSIPGPTGEEVFIRDAIIAELERIGVPRDAIHEDDAPARIDIPTSCGNLIVRIPGTAPGPARLLSAHMDTVMLARGAEPVMRGDRIVPKAKTALGGDDRTGVAAHAGVHPERGVSAIAIFAAAAADLDRGGWLGKIRRLEGEGTSNIGVVRAGDATNVVTDLLSARAEARSHDRTFLERIVGEYRRAFAAAATAHANAAGICGEASIHADEAYAAYRLAEDAPVVRAAFAATSAVGIEPRVRISDGGLDSNWLVRHGIPTASLGAGAHEAHTAGEYVVIDELLAACRLAREVCR